MRLYEIKIDDKTKELMDYVNAGKIDAFRAKYKMRVMEVIILATPVFSKLSKIGRTRFREWIKRFEK